MEIKLLNKELPVWLEEEPYYSRCQVSMDAVIPDSREDAARVLWSQGGLLLKGRDAAAHKLSVTGEVWVSVLYQTESGRLDTIRLRKEYDVGFELEEPDPEAPPLISCRLIGLEGKLLNPRKLSVSADIQTLMLPFRRGSLVLDAALPEDEEAGIHLLKETGEGLALETVREKSFTVREQLQPQGDTALPHSIAGESLSISNLETESLGTRSIVKGELELRIWGLDESEVPVSLRYRLPFSQLVETGDENADSILAHAEPSSVYLDWVEGIAGERSLDAEIHGVLQIRCFSKRSVCSVIDAYSSRMPSSPICEKRTILRSLERSTAVLSAEESFPLPDDLAELLASEAKLGPLESDREHVNQPVTMDLLYRDTDGKIGAFRRSLHLRGDPLEASSRPLAVRLQSCEASMEGGKLKLNGSAEVLLEQETKDQIEAVSAVELNEDAEWNPAELPALSLVFPANESLWELAKEYRSSVEAIKACNPEGSKMLLIPAE